MRIQVKSFGSQAGGSTLIGLVLGVCTGILMLIKWPELADYIEPHVQKYLAADLDSVALSIVKSPQNLADELPVQTDRPALTGIELKHGSDTAGDSLPSDFEHSLPVNNVEAAQTSVQTPAAIEIWEAFSTESSARRFAHAASEDLGIEIDVVEHSPTRFVPTVMCRQGTDCNSILSTINSMFSFEQTDA
jgi:hypothetical protein